MVLRFHDFYFMVFISREYLGVEVSFRYDEWHGDIGGIFMIPFALRRYNSPHGDSQLSGVGDLSCPAQKASASLPIAETEEVGDSERITPGRLRNTSGMMPKPSHGVVRT